MRRAEEAFNDSEATFAEREVAAVEAVESEIRGIIAGLESFRGLRPMGGDVEPEPIRRERQREPRLRKTVPVLPAPGE